MRPKRAKHACGLDATRPSAEGAFMSIERTLTQLQVNPRTAERAREIGQLGYMQWLGSLPAQACYLTEATCAYMAATPFRETDPDRKSVV